jgi:hypothetical protein
MPFVEIYVQLPARKIIEHIHFYSFVRIKVRCRPKSVYPLPHPLNAHPPPFSRGGTPGWAGYQN